MKYSFENLEVWQTARKLVKDICQKPINQLTYKLINLSTYKPINH